MKLKTLSDYPLLIGEMLRRSEARELRRFKRRNHPTMRQTLTNIALHLAWFFAFWFALRWLFRL